MARILGQRVYEEEVHLVNHLCLEAMVSDASGMYVASVLLMLLMRDV